MRAGLRTGLLLVGACLAGVTAGDLASSSMAVRATLGPRLGRGALLALCEDAGLYQSDVDRAEAEFRDRSPAANDDVVATKHVATLVSAAENLEAERSARHEPVMNRVADRQFDLLRSQFLPHTWLIALRSNGITSHFLRCMVEEHLRADSWIETEIHAALAVRPEECAAYYSAHSSAYTQPLRIRASHIFFAAPPGSSPALVEQKRASAQTVLDRIVSGEKFADLVVESEDEASKKRGGDLNFFSASRIPADFWAAINDGRVGQSAGMIRTKLGFHVAMVTDSRPVRAMTFDEVEREIAGALENQKRSLLLLALRRTLDGRIRWIPSGMYLSGATNTVN